jgi:hypothetical protein
VRRARGTANRITRDIKNGIIEAAVALGSDGKGKGGLVGYLKFLGKRHPKAFAQLLGKLMPLQVSTDGVGVALGPINIIAVPADRYLSSEDYREAPAAAAAASARRGGRDGGERDLVCQTMIETGTDAIREALATRARKLNTANLARDLGVASTTLDAFVAGQAKLPPETLQALARHLFHGHAELDVELDRLRPVNKTSPRPLGVAAPPFTPATYPPSFQPGPRPGWTE